MQPNATATKPVETIQPTVNVEEEESFLQNLSTDELLEVVAELVATFKCKTNEGREAFKSKYLAINRLALTLIGFDKALRKLPAVALKPEYAVYGGLAIMVTTAIFIKVDESQFIPKKVEVKSDIKKESNTANTQTSKAQTTNLPKDLELNEEEIQKFVDALEEVGGEEK